jgi:hypothetical protein
MPDPYPVPSGWVVKCEKCGAPLFARTKGGTQYKLLKHMRKIHGAGK